MDSFYLLVVARRLNGHPDTMSRVAKCVFDRNAVCEGIQTGRWYRLEIFDNPFPHMLDLVFVGLSSDPGIRAAEALSDRFEASLNRASRSRWKVDSCGPIDADDAALLRIELEVV
jgi:hypothetical protein